MSFYSNIKDKKIAANIKTTTTKKKTKPFNLVSLYTNILKMYNTPITIDNYYTWCNKELLFLKNNSPIKLSKNKSILNNIINEKTRKIVLDNIDNIEYKNVEVKDKNCELICRVDGVVNNKLIKLCYSDVISEHIINNALITLYFVRNNINELSNIENVLFLLIDNNKTENFINDITINVYKNRYYNIEQELSNIKDFVKNLELNNKHNMKNTINKNCNTCIYNYIC